jgi:hypothetical protein
LIESTSDYTFSEMRSIATTKNRGIVIPLATSRSRVLVQELQSCMSTDANDSEEAQDTP